MINIDAATLRTIRGLDFAAPVSERQLKDYNLEMDEFIETLPAKSYELTKMFVVRDYELLRKKLVDMSAVLARLRAGEAIAQLNRVLDMLPGENKPEVDIELGKLVAGLSALSIDLQLAQYRIGQAAQSPPSHAAPKEGEKHAPPAESGEVKTVLAVDDDPVILNVVKVIVEGVGHKFAGAATGKAALRYLEKNRPALCILDIEMPEMNGYELAAAISAIDTAIPLIFLTSNSQREHVTKAIKLGAQGFFVKPPDEDLIFNTLKQRLG
ncbi:MAG: response regulator [Oscillospiraceae bacterium]|jgi:CheY-like chemotaxis protein|nr:response regulator [Oscillospiraceae bacterium]